MVWFDVTGSTNCICCCCRRTYTVGCWLCIAVTSTGHCIVFRRTSGVRRCQCRRRDVYSCLVITPIKTTVVYRSVICTDVDIQIVVGTKRPHRLSGVIGTNTHAIIVSPHHNDRIVGNKTAQEQQQVTRHVDFERTPPCVVL